MFPIQINPLEAQREIVDFNRKVLAGMDTLANVEDVEVGFSPKEEIYREDKTVLYRYESRVENPHPIPVVIVYALVNRPYMVDLEPGRSMVENLLNLGLDVYLVDWGYVDRGDRYLTLDDYVNGYIDNCVRAVCERHGLDSVNVLGICQGGTMSLCYTSLHPDRVKNLITMVTPVDFHVTDGLLNIWSQHFDVDLMVDTFGNVPGDFMNGGFLMLKPFQLTAQKYVGFTDTLEDEDSVRTFLRMEKWIFDSPDQAGETFRQFMKDFYQQNKLIKGEAYIGNRRVDLSNVTMPVLNIYAQQDHLVPPNSSRELEKHVGSDDVKTIAFPGGHIGIYVSGKAQRDLAPALVDWVKERG